jgi:hypothetical protein
MAPALIAGATIRVQSFPPAQSTNFNWAFRRGRPAEIVVASYNKRGMDTAVMPLANAVRLQLHALAYNLGNFLRTLATPEPIKDPMGR